MSITIERLKGYDYEQLIDFIDLVYSQYKRPHHFPRDLPLLFAPTDEYMRNQYVIREGGKIRSVVGAIPYTYFVGSERFTTKTIANVSTHHLHTGKGYMQLLLAQVIEDMKAEGVDFATLHGHRERYRYSGFESAGVTNQARFTKSNALNLIKKGQETLYHFKELSEKDSDEIRQCISLFEKEPQHYRRPEDTFMHTMHMWHSTPYLVLDNKENFCGYCNVNAQKNHIQELLLLDSNIASEVISSFILEFDLSNVTINLSPFNKEMLRIAYSTSESISTNIMCQVSIYQFERLLAACLNIKKKFVSYMPKGQFVLSSMFGRHLIQNDGSFTVTQTNHTENIVINGYEVYSFLFGPSEYVIPYDRDMLGPFSTWFPVPLYIHSVDRY